NVQLPDGGVLSRDTEDPVDFIARALLQEKKENKTGPDDVVTPHKGVGEESLIQSSLPPPPHPVERSAVGRKEPWPIRQRP
ncbi:hypothetical protein LEMLEM_LOCUS9500, partial [Lemmus lemmus]